MLDLAMIRTDGGTQSREHLDEGTVSEYAEAYIAGAVFPPVTVFFDGSDRWLADGFHRYFAAKKAGKTSILENIIPGTLRDAKLHSYGANGSHGLRSTHADKRKAVTAMMGDDEWSRWSDRKIAEACGVSVSFVGSIRRPEVAAKQKENRSKSASKEASVCSPTTPVSATERVSAPEPRDPDQVKAAPKPKKLEAEEKEYFGPSAEEIDAAQSALQSDMSAIELLIQSDDKLATAMAEVNRLKAELSVVSLARDGFMNRCNELITRIKTLKRQLEQAKESSRV